MARANTRRQQRHTTPCVYCNLNGKEIRNPRSSPTARLSVALAPAELESEKQKGTCCALIIIGVVAICFLTFNVAMAIVVLQNWESSPLQAATQDCKDSPNSPNKFLRCRLLQNIPLPSQYQTTTNAFSSQPQQTSVTKSVRGLVTVRSWGVPKKAPVKVPAIQRSLLDMALAGISCTNPTRKGVDRQQHGPEKNRVVIFTHLRRTGGSVLEKAVLWPGVACDQGLVRPPPPQPRMSTAGGHLSNMEVKVPGSSMLSLPERRAAQQATLACEQEPCDIIGTPDSCGHPTRLAKSPLSQPRLACGPPSPCVAMPFPWSQERDSKLASVLYNCHEGSVGRFASASVSDRLKLAGKLSSAALIWRHCPYGVHALLPGGNMAMAQITPHDEGENSSFHLPLPPPPLLKNLSYVTLLRDPVERLMSWQAWCDQCVRLKKHSKNIRERQSARCCGSGATVVRKGKSNITSYYLERAERLRLPTSHASAPRGPTIMVRSSSQLAVQAKANPNMLPERAELLLDDNYATRMLCGSSTYGEIAADGTRALVGDAFGLDGRIGPTHLRCAMRHLLCKYRFFGMTSRLNESVCVLNMLFGWKQRPVPHSHETDSRGDKVPSDFMMHHAGLVKYDMQLVALGAALFEETLDRWPHCRKQPRPHRKATTAARDGALTAAGIDLSEVAECGWRP